MQYFTDLELLEFRKFIYSQVSKTCADFGGPEFKDFEQIKPKMVPIIARRIWEKLDKPKNKDVDIWFEAENVWHFVRYMW